MPILALSVMAGSPGKERPAMKMDTVNPIPATAPNPPTWVQVVPRGSREIPSRTARKHAIRMPTGLPTTRPTPIATATVDVTASPSPPPPR